MTSSFFTVDCSQQLFHSSYLTVAFSQLTAKVNTPLGGVWFKNIREQNDFVPDFENRMDSLRIWKKERSRSDFLFGWRNISAHVTEPFNTI
jgi:hypothetical protein